MRDPFWLDPRAQGDVETAFERLADLTEQAAVAARKAADEIQVELERTVPPREGTEDQGSEDAQLLRSAHARLTKFSREAYDLARLLRKSEAPEPARSAEPDESESVSPGARVLARQLAADGHSSDEIEARLAEEFGVSDARAVVEQMLRSKQPKMR